MIESQFIKEQKAKNAYDYYAWPGGYELIYICADGGILCADCANVNIEATKDPDDEQWFIISAEINYEDNGLYCVHCNDRIISEYGEDDDEN